MVTHRVVVVGLALAMTDSSEGRGQTSGVDVIG